MFLEKHEPAAIEEFSWFDEKGNFIDSEEPSIKMQLSKINRYIVEISQNNKVVIPPFLFWLFEKGYKIYCINDCRSSVTEMTNIQRIFFEREKAKGNWIDLNKNSHIYQKEFNHVEEIELIVDTFLLFSKNSLDNTNLLNLYEDFKMKDSRFPNLSFPRTLPKYRDLIIAKVFWGESYFKPGTTEEPAVLVCYTVQKL